MSPVTRLSQNFYHAFAFAFGHSHSKAKTKAKACSAGMLLLTACVPALVGGQGAGATGAQVLQFVAGSRAAALSGAYTAASGDADALFYNPAGVATLQRGAALAYERYVADVALASFGGVLSLGRLTVGLGGVYLDGGEIDELVPDPDFGGNRGIATGRSVSATEMVARLSAATSLTDRLRLGASVGIVSASIGDGETVANLPSGASSRAPSFDVGAQYELSFGTVGIALRNVGTRISGDDVTSAPQPTEARLGVATQFARADGLGVTLHSDLIARINEGSAGLVFGVEGGWQPTAHRTVGAVARLGYSAAEGEGGLAAVKFGAGISMPQLALDYTYQHLDFLGSVHRLGLRWSVTR
jgi:hypothetical protein